MQESRFLAAAAALFIAVLPARADQILGPDRIDNSGRVTLPGGPKTDLWQGGKFTSEPDAGKLGASQEPYAANSVTTTGTASSGSTTLAVQSATGINIGDVANGLGIPTDTQVQAVSGNTITLTKPTTAALSTGTVRFGADRWDLSSFGLGNSLGVRSLFIGDAAKGRSTWLASVGAGGADYYQVSPLTVLNPHGGVGATFGVRMSDEINNPSNLGAIIALQEHCLIDQQSSTPKNSWCNYKQGTLLPGAVGYHLNEENSISSQWPTVDVDPYTVNPRGRTINLRLDSGIGPGVGGIYNNVKNSSAYIDFVNNGAAARAGINVGVSALDTSSGRIAPFAQLPPNVGIASWYGAAGTRVWDMVGTATGGYGKLELLQGEARFSSTSNIAVGISGSDKTQRSVNFETNGIARFSTGLPSDGSNDYTIARFVGGAYQNIPFRMSNATGQISMFNVAITGGTISGTSIALPAYAVASLPTCNSSLRDTLAVATDATAPTYRGALTGGGTVRTPVYCDGNSWTAH